MSTTISFRIFHAKCLRNVLRLSIVLILCAQTEAAPQLLPGSSQIAVQTASTSLQSSATINKPLTTGPKELPGTNDVSSVLVTSTGADAIIPPTFSSRQGSSPTSQIPADAFTRSSEATIATGILASTVPVSPRDFAVSSQLAVEPNVPSPLPVTAPISQPAGESTAATEPAPIVSATITNSIDIPPTIITATNAPVPPVGDIPNTSADGQGPINTPGASISSVVVPAITSSPPPRPPVQPPISPASTPLAPPVPAFTGPVPPASPAATALAVPASTQAASLQVSVNSEFEVLTTATSVQKNDNGIDATVYEIVTVRRTPTVDTSANNSADGNFSGNHFLQISALTLISLSFTIFDCF